MARYSSSSPIYEDETVLREEFQPDTLPEREEKLDKLKISLAPAAREVGAKNVFIKGKAGQGKTEAARLELRRLKHHAETESANLDVTTLYLSLDAHDLSSTYMLCSKIYAELTGEERPKGRSTDEVMDMMFDAMNDIGGTIILVLDEIDNLGTDDQILYSLSRARDQNHVGDHVYPSLIGISNDLQWRDNLSPKVKSSLYDDQILFNPYDAQQLQQILYRRAAKAFKQTELVLLKDATQAEKAKGKEVKIKVVEEEDGEIETYVRDHLFMSDIIGDGVIPLISAYSARDKGDARQGLKYLRKAAEIAEDEGVDTISETHVERADESIQREAVLEAIEELTNHAGFALAAVAVLEHTGDTPARTKAVYGIYSNIAEEGGSDPLVQRRMREHLLDLDMQGILEKTEQRAGSVGGPAYKFSLRIDTDIVLDVLEDATRLDDLRGRVSR